MRRTCFNIVEKPQCLRLRAAKSVCDPLSYQQAWSDIFTGLELTHQSQMNATDDDDDCSDGRVVESSTRKLSTGVPMQHIVTVCTAPVKDGGTVPKVDIYITFTGQ